VIQLIAGEEEGEVLESRQRSRPLINARESLVEGILEHRCVNQMTADRGAGGVRHTRLQTATQRRCRRVGNGCLPPRRRNRTSHFPSEAPAGIRIPVFACEIVDVYFDAAYFLRAVLGELLRYLLAPAFALILLLAFVVAARVRQEEEKLREFLGRTAASVDTDGGLAGAIGSGSREVISR
jgi:hypothetical protein